jgi:glutamyl-tRNA reductase
MQRLLLLGMNHTTAPIELRERVAMNALQTQDTLVSFRAAYPESEVVAVSTCNRVELYASRPLHARPRPEDLVEFLARRGSIPADQVRQHSYELSDRAAVEHLFSVVSSLDSMVLGETQILGQVRQCYEAAKQAGAAGAMLNPLFQRALAAGKEVMHDTTLAAGHVSVASVAVDYARQIFDRFDDKTVLCVGAGKMAALAVAGFISLRPKALVVCNRDAARGGSLAARFSARRVPFDEVEQQLAAADIVISSTGSSQPIFTRQQLARVQKSRRFRSMFIIDIALPRDVDPSAADLERIYLYNLDDLQQAVARSLSGRASAVHVDEFFVSQRQRDLGPLIDRLYRHFHSVAMEELVRTLPKLGTIEASDREQLEEMLHRVVSKLLHDPVHTMRHADELHDPGSQYLHAIERLFRLDHHLSHPGTQRGQDAGDNEA